MAPAATDTERAAWDRYLLRPRYLRGLPDIDTAITFRNSTGAGAGTEITLPTPVFVAPTAAHGLVHPDGEVATHRGAGDALYIYSNSATRTPAEVGAAAAGPWWAQQYLLTDRGRSRQFLDEVREAGAGAIVLTCDFGGRIGWSRFRSVVQSRLVTDSGAYPDLGWHRMSRQVEQALAPDDIAWVADNSGLPVWAKGLLHPGDARNAVAAGAAGVMVSNHGRRQLDGVMAAVDALPAVLDTVGADVPVLVDGGVRSGADVVRALALGAAAVGIGRPALWGLAARGADGVRAVLDLLTDEFATALASSGAATAAQLTRDLLVPAPSPLPTPLPAPLRGH
nr:alpha-hydroxy acid oxidase [Nakamurella aerolata]